MANDRVRLVIVSWPLDDASPLQIGVQPLGVIHPNPPCSLPHSYVMYWLVRAAPSHMLRLQNGRFDAPDRLFASMRVSGAYRTMRTCTVTLHSGMPCT